MKIHRTGRRFIVKSADKNGWVEILVACKDNRGTNKCLAKIPSVKPGSKKNSMLGAFRCDGLHRALIARRFFLLLLPRTYQARLFADIHQGKLRGVQQIQTAADQSGHAENAKQQASADHDAHEQLAAELSRHRAEQRHQARGGERTERRVNPLQRAQQMHSLFLDAIDLLNKSGSAKRRALDRKST